MNMGRPLSAEPSPPHYTDDALLVSKLEQPLSGCFSAELAEYKTPKIMWSAEFLHFGPESKCWVHLLLRAANDAC